MRTIVFIFLFVSIGGAAQTPLKYDSDNKVVYQNENAMGLSDLFKLMRPYEETFDLIESARDSRFTSQVFGFLGGIGIGYSVSDFFITKDMKWPVLGIGAGLIGGSVFFHFRAYKRLEKAVNSYNSNIGLSAFNKRPFEFSVGFTPYGLGMNLTF